MPRQYKSIKSRTHRKNGLIEEDIGFDDGSSDFYDDVVQNTRSESAASLAKTNLWRDFLVWLASLQDQGTSDTFDAVVRFAKGHWLLQMTVDSLDNHTGRARLVSNSENGVLSEFNFTTPDQPDHKYRVAISCRPVDYSLTGTISPWVVAKRETLGHLLEAVKELSEKDFVFAGHLAFLQLPESLRPAIPAQLSHQLGFTLDDPQEQALRLQHNLGPIISGAGYSDLVEALAASANGAAVPESAVYKFPRKIINAACETRAEAPAQPDTRMYNPHPILPFACFYTNSHLELHVFNIDTKLLAPADMQAYCEESLPHVLEIWNRFRGTEYSPDQLAIASSVQYASENYRDLCQAVSVVIVIHFLTKNPSSGVITEHRCVAMHIDKNKRYSASDSVTPDNLNAAAYDDLFFAVHYNQGKGDLT